VTYTVLLPQPTSASVPIMIGMSRFMLILYPFF